MQDRKTPNQKVLRIGSAMKVLPPFVGLAFIALFLVLAGTLPQPTASTFLIFRVAIAIAGAVTVAFLPETFSFEIRNYLRIGGAFAVFIVVYAVNPLMLVVPPDVELVERGELALSKGNISSAITLFAEATRHNPANWRIQSGLARSYYARGDYDSARNAFEKAVVLSRKREWAPALGLSMAQEGARDIDGAIASLDVAASLLKDEPVAEDIRFDIGRLLVRQWLEREAPSTSDRYARATKLMTEFVLGAGQPKHWALYHLACLKATAATGPAMDKATADVLRGEAARLLRKSVEMLGGYASPRAEQQRTLMRQLLEGGSKLYAQPGDPIECKALRPLWASMRKS
jgi:tetratricopeptide (TPR) repeat protein